MPRKPIPELAPDAPELRRADAVCPACGRTRCQPGQAWDSTMCACDVPVSLPDPTRPETMPVAELSNLAGPRGQVIVPEHIDTLMAQYRRAEQLLAAGHATMSAAPTNIDRTTARGKALLTNAGNPGDIEMGPEKVVRLRATHYVIFPDRQPDEETGEIRFFARTCLVTEDGRMFRTTSQHAPDRLAAALSLYTAEEWAAGIPFVIRARPSKRKGRADWHDMRIDMEQLPAGG